jgi:hypothetical protein
MGQGTMGIVCWEKTEPVPYKMKMIHPKMLGQGRVSP